jgi:hypothetical protein
MEMRLVRPLTVVSALFTRLERMRTVRTAVSRFGQQRFGKAKQT